MSKVPAPSLGSFLVRSLLTLVIPQGYTLSIAGSFAVAVRRYGFPDDLDAWTFVAGAVLAFILLAVIGHGVLRGSIAELPMGLRALINVVPLVVVLAVIGVVGLIAQSSIGFPMAGLIGAWWLCRVAVRFPVAGRDRGHQKTEYLTFLELTRFGGQLMTTDTSPTDQRGAERPKPGLIVREHRS
jgi:hypothetical protein